MSMKTIHELIFKKKRPQKLPCTFEPFLSMTNLVLYQIYRSPCLKHGSHLENIENGKPVFTNNDTSDINRLVNFPIDPSIEAYSSLC